MLSLALTILALAAPPTPDEPTNPYESSRFGVGLNIPTAWPVVVKEQEDRVFVSLIPQEADPERPGVLACEISIAPESLYEYSRRIEGNERRAQRAGTLTRNEVVPTSSGPRLETVRQYKPGPGVTWIERSVRFIANRQLYTVILNCREETYAAVLPSFEKVLNSLTFTPPGTGVTLEDAIANRWLQREFQFTMELPTNWRPVVAPAEIALLYANGPARGIWSDNCLVIASEHRPTTLAEQAERLPDQLRAEEPGCEVLQCLIVPQGKREALETVVRTKRGPFSMTVLERRFVGDRFDYEVKFTLESDRFDELAPTLRKSLDSFNEQPGLVPGGGRPT